MLAARYSFLYQGDYDETKWAEICSVTTLLSDAETSMEKAEAKKRSADLGNPFIPPPDQR